MSGFLSFEKKNHREYGKVCFSYREGGEVKKRYLYLGLVVDKEKLVFRNRKQGTIKYDPVDGSITPLDPSAIPASDHGEKKERVILDFGDAFFLDEFIRRDGLLPALQAIECTDPDTLFSMLDYYILCPMANCHAQEWWEGSYARILYPHANLADRHISDFLEEIGDEGRIRGFFHEYLRYVSAKAGGSGNILIDRTVLPNGVHFPLTAVSDHNGNVSNEVRLIYATQQETGLPVCFRDVPGNITDAGTLVHTMAELRRAGVDVRFVILDAGYDTEENAEYFLQENVPFLMRLGENRKGYRTLVEEHLPGIQSGENLVEYNGRTLYVRHAETGPAGHRCHAYLCLDMERNGAETQKPFPRTEAQKTVRSEGLRRMNPQGVFVLVSSREIPVEEVLPLYDTRHQIDRIFDIGKNDADLLPVRIRKEETFRGHLLLAFMAGVVVKRIEQELRKTTYDPESMFLKLRNQKCKVYEDAVIPQEADRKSDDCYRLFGISCPAEIPVN